MHEPGITNGMLEVGSQSLGKIWQTTPALESDEQWRPVPDENWCILRVCTKQIPPNDGFRCVAFGCNSEGAFVACNLTSLYYFDINSNRFYAVAQLPHEPCSLTWNERLGDIALIALTNGTILCCSVGMRKVIAELQGHRTAPTSLLFHPLANLAVSSSDLEAFVWDLDGQAEKHRLNVQRNVPLIKVVFCNHDKLVAVFRDNAIFVWELDTLSQLDPVILHCDVAWQYTTVTMVGSLLVAGGSSSLLHVWDPEAMSLRKKVILPETMSGSQQMEGWSKPVQGVEHQMLTILDADGAICVIDFTAAELVSVIRGWDSAIKSVSTSVNGTYLALVLQSGVLDIIMMTECKQKDVQQVDSGSSTKLAFAQSQPLHAGEDVSSNRPISTVDSGSSPQPAIAQNQPLNAGEDTSRNNRQPMEFQLSKLHALLTKFGEYPVRYRQTVWKCLLSIPENKTAFQLLEQKGLHPSYLQVDRQFVLKTEKLQLKLQKLLSSLAFLSPTLARVEYLPHLVFPFLKIFPDNQLICFEVVLTLIANWCQHWFDYYPCPPLSVLGLVENLLSLHDPELLQHFIREGITAQVYAWPLLNTAFSEVCTKSEWLRLWDHLFSCHPSFIVCVVAAFNRTSRQTLLAYTDNQHFQLFFHQPTSFDLSAVLEEAYRIDKDTPDSNHPRSRVQDFAPLVEGAYVDPVSKTRLARRPSSNENVPCPLSSRPALSSNLARQSSVEVAPQAHNNCQDTPKSAEPQTSRSCTQNERGSSPNMQGLISRCASIIPDTLELRWRLARSTYRRAAYK